MEFLFHFKLVLYWKDFAFIISIIRVSVQGQQIMLFTYEIIKRNYFVPFKIL
jgi:hypothetical protein